MPEKNKNIDQTGPPPNVGPNPNLTTVTFRVPKALKKQFQICCLQGDVEQTQVIVAAIEAYVIRGTLPSEVSQGLAAKDRRLFDMLSRIIGTPWRKVIEYLMETITAELNHRSPSGRKIA